MCNYIVFTIHNAIQYNTIRVRKKKSYTPCRHEMKMYNLYVICGRGEVYRAGWGLSIEGTQQVETEQLLIMWLRWSLQLLGFAFYRKPGPAVFAMPGDGKKWEVRLFRMGRSRHQNKTKTGVWWQKFEDSYEVTHSVKDGMFHENILTISLINIHYLYSNQLILTISALKKGWVFPLKMPSITKFYVNESYC